MCGFFGWFRPQNKLNNSETEHSLQSLRRLAHRGPDSESFWINPRKTLFLGHRRLKVIDLSDAASQPMHDLSNRFHVVFNGEIYNFLSLKKQLERDGEILTTKSDTEVLLKIFIKYGVIEGLKQLEGMFSGAFYDSMEDMIWIFRDHLGQKPLYYFKTDSELIFASELQGIIGLSNFNWKISKINFARYVINSYYSLGDTPIENIHKLLPGTCSIYSGSELTTIRWWESIPGESHGQFTTSERVIDEFEDLFDKSCQLSSVSDVPMGLFMSGGLDSTLIASSSKKMKLDLQILHASMGDLDFDESWKANSVAKQLGIDNMMNISMDYSHIRGNFDKVTSVIDEPNGDPGFINAFALSEAAKKEISVVMTGDGADELLGGYLPFKALRYSPILDLVPKEMAKFFSSCLDFVKDGDGYLDFSFKARSFIAGAYNKNEPYIHRWLATTDEYEASKLMPHLVEDGAMDLDYSCDRSISSNLNKLDPMNAQLYYYQKVFLPEFICLHTDRASMMNGLEARSPFLTKDIIEFCNKLPAQYKIKNGQQKWLIKSILKRRGFPKEIYEQKKQGFTFPIARMLKTILLKETMNLLSDGDLFGGVIKVKSLDRIIQDHLNGVRNNYRIIYTLIIFHAWRKRFPAITF